MCKGGNTGERTKKFIMFIINVNIIYSVCLTQKSLAGPHRLASQYLIVHHMIFVSKKTSWIMGYKQNILCHHQRTRPQSNVPEHKNVAKLGLARLKATHKIYESYNNTG